MSRLMTVVCAWCQRIVVAAAADEGVTHTICPSCLDWTLEHPGEGPPSAAAVDRLAIPPAYFAGRH